MADNRIEQLVAAEAGTGAVLQGNLAFAVGCVRAGIHVADGYPGTPSTEVIDKGLRFVQDRMRVGWSVNEANAVAVGFGATMTGADAVVTMKIPGLFQAMGLSKKLLQNIIEPGTILGPLTEEVARETGFFGVPVVARCTGDEAFSGRTTTIAPAAGK